VFLFCWSEHSSCHKMSWQMSAVCSVAAAVFCAMIKTLHVQCLILCCCVIICAGAGVFCEPVWYEGSLGHQLWQVIWYTNHRYFWLPTAASAPYVYRGIQLHFHRYVVDSIWCSSENILFLCRAVILLSLASSCQLTDHIIPLEPTGNFISHKV
jgi:hypothetical protein